jgi:hypothetical protein
MCTLAVKKKIRAGFDMSDRTIPFLRIKLKGGLLSGTTIFRVSTTQLNLSISNVFEECVYRRFMIYIGISYSLTEDKTTLIV